MGTVEEEVDETIYWLELLESTDTYNKQSLVSIMMEAEEILSITIASIKTAKQRRKATKIPQSAIRNPK